MLLIYGHLSNRLSANKPNFVTSNLKQNKVMKFSIIFAIALFISTYSFSQSRFSKQELGINAFRNPSIGLEYRYKFVSVHAGYYVTNFETDITTQFLKIGTALWFLPVGKRENPSSFYAQFSYLRGLNRDYKDANAGSVDVGFRFMVYKGLNLRLGVIALFSEGKSIKINPTPSIGYSFFF